MITVDHGLHRELMMTRENLREMKYATWYLEVNYPSTMPLIKIFEHPIAAKGDFEVTPQLRLPGIHPAHQVEA